MRKTGNNLRLILDGKCIAAAKDCSFHVAVQTEDATTKDSTGAWTAEELVSKSWDASGNALVVFDAGDDNSAQTASKLLANICGNNSLLTIEFTETAGDQNRTKSQTPVIYRTGRGLLTDFSLSSAAGQRPTFSYQIKGNGALQTSETEFTEPSGETPTLQ